MGECQGGSSQANYREVLVRKTSAGNSSLIEAQQPADKAVGESPDIVVVHRKYRSDHVRADLDYTMVGAVHK